MDIFLVHLVASVLSALCVKYLANLKINIFLRILFIALFMAFVFYGLFLCFFLTIILLPFLKEKPLVIGSSDIKKYEDSETIKAIRKAVAIKNKKAFFEILCCLVLISVVCFDSFRIYKFKYKCATGKNYKVEILDDNYTLDKISFAQTDLGKRCFNSSLSDLQTECGTKMGFKNTVVVKYYDKVIANIYNYFLPYNYFNAKMYSVSYPNHYDVCGYKNKDEIIKILKENLEKDKRWVKNSGLIKFMHN